MHVFFCSLCMNTQHASYMWWKTIASRRRANRSCVECQRAWLLPLVYQLKGKGGRRDGPLELSVQCERLQIRRCIYYVFVELQRTSSDDQPSVTLDAFCDSSLSKSWPPSCWTRSSSYVAIEPMTCRKQHTNYEQEAWKVSVKKHAGWLTRTTELSRSKSFLWVVTCR